MLGKSTIGQVEGGEQVRTAIQPFKPKHVDGSLTFTRLLKGKQKKQVFSIFVAYVPHSFEPNIKTKNK